jgi:flagellar hook-length control protein FliK
MNDLNLAALQAVRQANAGGSRAAPTRDADDAAADFDRVMARVAREDAAAAQPREAPARGDARRSDDDPSPSPAAGAADDGNAAGAGTAADANAAIPAAAQFAAVVVTNDTAGSATSQDDRAAAVDSTCGVKPFATSVPQAPLNGHRPPMSSATDATAKSAAPHAAEVKAASPRNAARAAVPVATQPAIADADRSAAAAPAGLASEHAGEPALPRFEAAAATAQPALRAESFGVQNPVASAFASHAPQTYSIAHAKIATPVLHPGFGEDLANRVVFLAGQRVQSAELALTPADLGPLAVTIELRGQEAHLFFGAAHATTRAAIEDALPRLREMFAGSGLQLADAQIGDHGRRDFARPQRGAGEPMRAIGAVQVAPDLLRPTRAAHPDRLIDVVV